jgi:hypothetical protein
MRRKTVWNGALHCLLVLLLFVLPVLVMAQEGGGEAPRKLTQAELAQLLAPVALYPDEVVSQILMASTYPLEVVQADRWVQGNKGLKGEALTKALEKESWDASVKALVNFPSVLSAMSQKLELTTKIGDAFLSQQKDVMETIQLLRRKAQETGNLKSTKEQKVIVEKETIIIKPADPQVVYVPTYSTTVVYGTWMYPAYPPAYYYPPPPPPPPGVPPPVVTFTMGVAVGAYFSNYNHCDWHHGYVYPPPPPPPPPPPGGRPPGGQPPPPGGRPPGGQPPPSGTMPPGGAPPPSATNTAAKPSGGAGATQQAWQHNPEHRKGVAYKDSATATKYGQSPARSMEGRRDATRGYGGGRGSGATARPSAGTMDRGAGQRGTAGAGGAGVSDRSAGQRASAGSGRDSAFGGGSGSQERMASDRGASSRQGGGNAGGFSRSSGGFGGGGGRSFGGGGRGGRR